MDEYPAGAMMPNCPNGFRKPATRFTIGVQKLSSITSRCEKCDQAHSEYQKSLVRRNYERDVKSGRLRPVPQAPPDCH